MSRDVGEAAANEFADDVAAAFTLTRDGEWLVGMPPRWFDRDHLFGGILIGQAVAAACHGQPSERRIHSLHAYFLRAGTTRIPVRFAVRPLREGRTLAQFTVEAWQEERHLLSMTCSFTADTDGYEYQLPMADVPPPPDQPGPSGFPGFIERMGPTPADADGTMRSTARNWLRTAALLPDATALHAAVLAYYSDITATGGRPLHLEGSVEGLISLDHALWFHRPARADEWLLFDVHSLVNTGGRGLLRGGLYTADGVLVASMAQEMIVGQVNARGSDNK